ncbi:hypothetical protein ASE22_03865 [Sphingomonas sp. Root720]|nr:hypothetical protein ASE22_03865 [Sphingomonas sp. Root720]
MGAAGGTGRPLVAELERRGVPVRAVVRRPEQMAMFADARVADLHDVDQIARAIEGACVVHLIPPVFNDQEPLFAANAMVAAEAAGIARFTYHSVLHAPTPAMPHHLRKSQVELMLRESALVWTIIQPAMYVQTCFTFLDQRAGAFTPPFRLDGLYNPVDLPDLIEATANILSAGDAHAFATYELAGTERLTPTGMGTILQEALDPAIRTVQAPITAFAQARASRRGLDQRQTGELVAMYRHYDGYGLPGNGHVLEMILGRSSHRFADAVRREYRASGGASAAQRENA